MASSRPASGLAPTSGLWGAEDGAKRYAVRGPVEHQAGLKHRLFGRRMPRAACCNVLLRQEGQQGLHQRHKDHSRWADSWLGPVYSHPLRADAPSLTSGGSPSFDLASVRIGGLPQSQTWCCSRAVDDTASGSRNRSCFNNRRSSAVSAGGLRQQTCPCSSTPTALRTLSQHGMMLRGSTRLFGALTHLNQRPGLTNKYFESAINCAVCKRT